MCQEESVPIVAGAKKAIYILNQCFVSLEMNLCAYVLVALLDSFSFEMPFHTNGVDRHKVSCYYF